MHTLQFFSVEICTEYLNVLKKKWIRLQLFYNTQNLTFLNLGKLQKCALVNSQIVTFNIIIKDIFYHLLCYSYRKLSMPLLVPCSSKQRSCRSYLPTPPLWQDMTQGQFLSGVLQVWIQSFPSPRLVASPRLKISLPYYLPIAGGRVIGFIPFPRVLVLCEMQSVSSRIRSSGRVANAVSMHYMDAN